MYEILQGLLLAAPAGFNAYLPLLIVGIAARVGWIQLAEPIQPLSSEPALVVLAVLLLVEVLADKVPGIDHVNDVIGTVVRPAAGVILFAANGNGIVEMHPVFAVVVGLLAAGSIHGVKAISRPVVNVSTAGVGAPVVSFLEDVAAFVITVLALFVPVVGAVLLVVLGVWMVLRWQSWRNHRRRESLAGGNLR